MGRTAEKAQIFKEVGSRDTFHIGAYKLLGESGNLGLDGKGLCLIQVKTTQELGVGGVFNLWLA